MLLSACVGPDGQMMPMGEMMGGGQGGYPQQTPPSGYGQPAGYPQQGGYSGGQAPQGYPGAAPYPGAGQQGYYAPPSQPQTQMPPPTSDYPPHLRDEYRTAYDIGARDRSYGYLSDYKRAYTKFGHGFEAYFQEGYNDGFQGAQMRH